ncbi:hypothetical protein RFI_20659 [Reticulomyxa filosa]|uniref:GYF domain-containing protein n=1 Tax=Reticulomyxa filosa TaxID=46433 RepID=X6MRP5_RETFI|nr:hypothetical protein RFI_20659 [Reticulomyxa filosa]|eukprot:ETO16683.1 hypothetical protein RFI_20659 [Reticulomyxa filosa]
MNFEMALQEPVLPQLAMELTETEKQLQKEGPYNPIHKSFQRPSADRNETSGSPQNSHDMDGARLFFVPYHLLILCKSSISFVDTKKKKEKSAGRWISRRAQLLKQKEDSSPANESNNANHKDHKNDGSDDNTVNQSVEESQKNVSRQNNEKDIVNTHTNSIVDGILNGYAKNTNANDSSKLSEAHKTTKNSTAATSTKSDEWWYKDPQGFVQGPFAAFRMEQWFFGKYFKKELPIRCEQSSDFIELHQWFKASHPGWPYVIAVCFIVFICPKAFKRKKNLRLTCCACHSNLLAYRRRAKNEPLVFKSSNHATNSNENHFTDTLPDINTLKHTKHDKNGDYAFDMEVPSEPNRLKQGYQTPPSSDEFEEEVKKLSMNVITDDDPTQNEYPNHFDKEGEDEENEEHENEDEDEENGPLGHHLINEINSFDVIHNNQLFLVFILFYFIFTYSLLIKYPYQDQPMESNSTHFQMPTTLTGMRPFRYATIHARNETANTVPHSNLHDTNAVSLETSTNDVMQDSMDQYGYNVKQVPTTQQYFCKLVLVVLFALFCICVCEMSKTENEKKDKFVCTLRKLPKERKQQRANVTQKALLMDFVTQEDKAQPYANDERNTYNYDSYVYEQYNTKNNVSSEYVVGWTQPEEFENKHPNQSTVKCARSWNILFGCEHSGYCFHVGHIPLVCDSSFVNIHLTEETKSTFLEKSFSHPRYELHQSSGIQSTKSDPSAQLAEYTNTQTTYSPIPIDSMEPQPMQSIIRSGSIDSAHLHRRKPPVPHRSYLNSETYIAVSMNGLVISSLCFNCVFFFLQLSLFAHCTNC